MPKQLTGDEAKAKADLAERIKKARDREEAAKAEAERQSALAEEAARPFNARMDILREEESAAVSGFQHEAYMQRRAAESARSERLQLEAQYRAAGRSYMLIPADPEIRVAVRTEFRAGTGWAPAPELWRAGETVCLTVEVEAKGAEQDDRGRPVPKFVGLSLTLPHDAIRRAAALLAEVEDAAKKAADAEPNVILTPTDPAPP